MSLSSFITGGISGILLGLVTLFVVGPITFAFERLCGGNGKAAVACSTIAGTAMTTPVASPRSRRAMPSLRPPRMRRSPPPLSSRRSWLRF